MAPRNLPGLGLKAFASLFEGGWNEWTDENWRIVSALLQGRALSATTALPGSPTNGAIYIVPAGAGSHANEVAVRDAGAWIYLTPQSGWRFFVEDAGHQYEFDGTNWIGRLALPTGTDLVTDFGSAAARWARGWFGNLRLFPTNSVAPTINGEVTFELTSNTEIKIKVRGSDGIVRSGSIALT